MNILGKEQEMKTLLLPTLEDYNGPKFHPVNNQENQIKYYKIKMLTPKAKWSNTIYGTLTKSRTRENSGLLRVFKGKAGHRERISFVSGGNCFMNW